MTAQRTRAEDEGQVENGGQDGAASAATATNTSAVDGRGGLDGGGPDGGGRDDDRGGGTGKSHTDLRGTRARVSYCQAMNGELHGGLRGQASRSN